MNAAADEEEYLAVDIAKKEERVAVNNKDDIALGSGLLFPPLKTLLLRAVSVALGRLPLSRAKERYRGKKKQYADDDDDGDGDV